MKRSTIFWSVVLIITIVALSLFVGQDLAQSFLILLGFNSFLMLIFLSSETDIEDNPVLTVFSFLSYLGIMVILGLVILKGVKKFNKFLDGE